MTDKIVRLEDVLSLVDQMIGVISQHGRSQTREDSIRLLQVAKSEFRKLRTVQLSEVASIKGVPIPGNKDWEYDDDAPVLSPPAHPGQVSLVAGEKQKYVEEKLTNG
jgi:hypothetical protein